MSAAYDRPDDSFEAPIPETSKRRTREQSQLEFELDFLGRVLERDPLYGDALKVHADNLAAKGYYNRALQADCSSSGSVPTDRSPGITWPAAMPCWG